MRTFVVFNAKAGSATSAQALRERLSERGNVTLVEPESPDETRPRGARAKQEGYDVIVAAGGDGTIHAVVNGLAPDFHRGALVLCRPASGHGQRPPGSATLAIPEDPLEALNLLDGGDERLIDVFRVDMPRQTCFGVNTASGGFSGQNARGR